MTCPFKNKSRRVTLLLKALLLLKSESCSFLEDSATKRLHLLLRSLKNQNLGAKLLRVEFPAYAVVLIFFSLAS